MSKNPALFQKLEARLRGEQSSHRFYHSQCVARLAGELGGAHGWDPEIARLAGLLHDWVKEWKPEKLIRYAKRHKLKVPNFELTVELSPNMLHAYVAAHFVRAQGWLKDKAALKAIASHTLGALPMSIEDKILYVADLASYDRRFPEAPEIREEALKNIHRGFASAIAVKQYYRLKKRKAIHPFAAEVWNRVVCGVKARA